MNVANDTDCCVHTLITGANRGRSFLSVIVKATFKIVPDQKAELADFQLPVVESDEYYGTKVPGSVRIESDLVPFKPHADVVFVGNAYAPGGRSTRSFLATLQIGTLTRSIAVIGDRYWKKSSGVMKSKLIPSDPEPVEVVEIVYERAFGGIDLDENNRGEWCSENPVGKGFVAKKHVKNAEDRPLPNIEDPNHLIRSWRDRPKPVGFGFYGQGWSPRVKYAGTYDEKWQRERAPHPPYDFLSVFYNGAHPDLQVRGYIRGDEGITMTHLTPQGHTRFSLSGLCPRVVMMGSQSRSENTNPTSIGLTDELKMNLDTICFLMEEGMFYQVWRGSRVVRSEECDVIEKLTVDWQ